VERKIVETKYLRVPHICEDGLNKVHKSAFRLVLVASSIWFFSQIQIPLPAQTPAPEIIENPEQPKYSGKDAPELIFKQELSIPLEGRRYSFDVDDAGNIYLLDTRAARIAIYDKSGKPLITFGKKGQGPGEFESPAYLALSGENNIHVIDRPRRPVQVFDSRGSWLEQWQPSSIGRMMSSLAFDSSGSVYIQDSLNLVALQDKERIRRGVAALGRLSKFSSRFEKTGEIETWDNRFMKRGSGEATVLLYHDIFYYQLDRNSNLLCGDSSRYEIRQISPSGQVERLIRKKTKRIPTTEKDRARILENHPDLKEAVMAETKPFFLDFHVLDQIGLLIGTYEDEWNAERVLVCDLFDMDGVYITRVKIPRYYTRDHDIISEQRNRLFKKGFCYSIVYNTKADGLELVRHSFELKSTN
jgi:hypothetical protein